MKLDKSFVFKRFKKELEAKYGPKKAAAIWRYAGHVLQKLEAAEPDADKNSRSFVFPAVISTVQSGITRRMRPLQ